MLASARILQRQEPFFMFCRVAMKISLIVGVLMILALAGCDRPQKKIKIIKTSDLAAAIYTRFPSDKPGFGTTDYPGHTKADIPKSYAQILLAELARQRHGILPDLPNLANVAGRWLLDHSKEEDGLSVGWGVPIAWDAYGDGSVNAANTRYTISTAIVVDALLSWMETDPTSPGQEILRTVEAALKPYALPINRSPSGLAPYSLQEVDRKYDTFNPAAYLASQLQRFSHRTEDREFAEALRAAADATVLSLLKHKRSNNKTGGWYWTYSVQENVPNDLPHAGYIIEGLRQYVHYGGRYAAKIKLEEISQHLGDFYDHKKNYMRAWPRSRQDIDRPARTYDIGIALTLVCQLPGFDQEKKQLLSELPKYQTDKGPYLKYPRGSKIADQISVNEYEAYLYRGLIECAIKEGRELSNTTKIINQEGTPDEHLLAPIDLPGSEVKSFTDRSVTDHFKRIPFVQINGTHDDHTHISVWQKKQSNEPVIRISGKAGPLLHFAEGQIPLHLISLGKQKRAVFFRTYPDNKLFLAIVNENGNITDRMQIHHSPGSEPMFRIAALFKGQIWLAYYDNVTLNNYLTTFSDIEGNARISREKTIKLPLLEDPAGGTYEMIPAIFLLPGKTELHLIGGTLHATLQASGEFTSRRVPNCLRAIEAVLSPFGPVVLCAQKEKKGPGAPFELISTRPQKLPKLKAGAIPYRLRLEEGVINIRHADSPDSLRQMFEYDITRIQQNGWMEFGINNEEGRIAWSQIYYLNGLMDIVLLAQKSTAMYSTFSPILSQIRDRLDMEMALLEDHWQSGRYQTRAFTIDRSQALFAVQTSRLLLLMKRFNDELTQVPVLKSFEDVRRAVGRLEHHIEIMGHGGEPLHWLSYQGANLRWPKTSKFYFDGLAVPFNHQNEWAYSIERSGSQSSQVNADALAIIKHFIERIAPQGSLPNTGIWDYWWGTAYDGWKEKDAVSVNKPSYGGDHIKAWISFRTIDAMSSLALADKLGEPYRTNLVESAAHLMATGKLYPFVGFELIRHGQQPYLHEAVARDYIRISSPWEIGSAAWAYLNLAYQFESGKK